MLNVALFWEDFRENRKNLLIFCGVLLFFTLLNLGLYGWASGRLGANVFLDIPLSLARILGVDMTDKSLTGFLGGALYECWFLLILILFEMILSKRLVADQIKGRTMIYYIGSPLGREKVIFTQGYFLLFSVLVLIVAGSLEIVLLSELIFPGQLEIPQFLLLNIGFFFLHMTLSGIGFFFSCIGNNWKQVWLGTVVVVVFLFVYLIGKSVDGLWIFRYLSVISLYEVDGLLNGSKTLFIQLPLLAVLGGIIYWLGMKAFVQKDLRLAGKH